MTRSPIHIVYALPFGRFTKDKPMRHTRRSPLSPGMVAIAVASALSAGAIAQPAKLDAALTMFATNPAVAVKVFAASLPEGANALATTGEAMLPVTIRLVDGVDFDTAVAQMRTSGAQVGSRLGPIVTARAPVSALRALAGLDAVMVIELSRATVPRRD